MHRIHTIPASRQLRMAETWDLVGRIETATDAGKIEAQLLQIASSYGLSSLFAGWVPSLKTPIAQPEVAANILHDHAPGEWSKRYVEQNYIHHDPIVERLQQDTMPFTWQDAYGSCPSRTDAELIDGEASSFGLRTGYVVPVPLLGGLTLAFSFGGAAMEAEPGALSTLAFVTNVAAGHLVNLARCRSHRDGRDLTPREVDCLSWSAEGKTAGEIGTILGVSPCTVVKHLTAAREKLDAINKSQAVAKAIRLKIIG